MGFLAAATGRGDLVDVVAATDNHVRLGALRSGPVLDWLPDVGLTQEEAAAVQPGYGCGSMFCANPPPPAPPAPEPTAAGASWEAALAWTLAVFLALLPMQYWGLRRIEQGRLLARWGRTRAVGTAIAAGPVVAAAAGIALASVGGLR